MTHPADRSTAAEVWARALAVIPLLAADAHRLGGALVRARAGPVRDAWLEHLRTSLAPGTPLRRMPVNIADDRLLGGLDLTATLAHGRAVAASGLLAEADGGLLVVHGAERLASGTVSRLCAALDRGAIVLAREGVNLTCPARIGLIALDEGLDDDPPVAAALASRLAFHVDLEAVGLTELVGTHGATTERAGSRFSNMTHGLDLPAATIGESELIALAALAAKLGIVDLSACLLASRVAVGLATARGDATVSHADLAEAVGLVLAPRATRLPDQDADTPPDQSDEETHRETPPPPPPDQMDTDTHPPPDPQVPEVIPEDMLLAAALASLPPGLLADLKQGALARRATSGQGGEGQKRHSAVRGRPVGVMSGALGQGARLALVDTLRAAAPWQTLRRREGASPDRIAVRKSDIRVRRFAERSESTVIFLVDASGSAAFERLAEVKGAVEKILADAYSARTHVALVTFRGTGADVLLPATRSLTRARALLAGLPGGGATPLAAGLEAATNLALGERRKGRTPLLLVMSDARANISREGHADRRVAVEQAHAAAKRVAQERVATVLIDTARWPGEQAAALAASLNARYAPLPRADAGAMQALAADMIAEGGRK